MRNQVKFEWYKRLTIELNYKEYDLNMHIYSLNICIDIQRLNLHPTFDVSIQISRELNLIMMENWNKKKLIINKLVKKKPYFDYYFLIIHDMIRNIFWTFIFLEILPIFLI